MYQSGDRCRGWVALGQRDVMSSSEVEDEGCVWTSTYFQLVHMATKLQQLMEHVCASVKHVLQMDPRT